MPSMPSGGGASNAAASMPTAPNYTYMYMYCYVCTHILFLCVGQKGPRTVNFHGNAIWSSSCLCHGHCLCLRFSLLPILTFTTRVHFRNVERFIRICSLLQSYLKQYIKNIKLIWSTFVCSLNVLFPRLSQCFSFLLWAFHRRRYCISIQLYFSCCQRCSASIFQLLRFWTSCVFAFTFHRILLLVLTCAQQ